MTAQEAFKWGYMRGMYKVMDAVHTAFRKHWEAAEIEAMLRRMAEERIAEAEAKAFEAAQGEKSHGE